ncbi:MAG: NADH-quinone oxidoreductase subunit J, partial [Planctomycetota bacterium]|nr:NADH-quinone oxidoreductase subunit J [Planctomycetota bacterium]
AEFLGFAVVIVYAGAILITYMFVLMLAQQAQSPDLEDERPTYDRFAREPIGGAVVAFLLLAFMNHLIFTGTGELTPGDADPVPARLAAWERVGNLPGRVMELVVQVPDCELASLPEADALRVVPDPDGLAATVTVMLNDAPAEVRLEGELARLAIEDNIRGVGVALIEAFPVSLELAGVVLTMAMFGAVILARRQIELTEDEKREASGLPRIGHHDDPKSGEVTHG